jgi:hypothetical protein
MFILLHSQLPCLCSVLYWYLIVSQSNSLGVWIFTWKCSPFLFKLSMVLINLLIWLLVAVQRKILLCSRGWEHHKTVLVYHSSCSWSWCPIYIWSHRYVWLAIGSVCLYYRHCGPCIPAVCSCICVWLRFFQWIGCSGSYMRWCPLIGTLFAGDLGQTYDSNRTLTHYENNPAKGQAVLFVGDLSYADNYPNHDNVRWDTWGRFVERSVAYQPWIWTAGNHEIDFAPDIVSIYYHSLSSNQE